MLTCAIDQCDVVSNRILRDMEPGCLRQVLGRLEPVRLEINTTISQVGRPVDYVYFVESGVVSMISTMADGGSAEVGVVGAEGVVGLPPLFGTRVAYLDALVQVEGSARRMGATSFRWMLDTTPSLRGALLRYAHAFHLQVAQTAACNARHTIEKRLARWILTMADRVEDSRFRTTHETVAQMLSVQRPGVSLGLQRLQNAGLIRPTRGWMHIVDRPGLEDAGCECYSVVRDLFEPARGCVVHHDGERPHVVERHDRSGLRSSLCKAGISYS